MFKAKYFVPHKKNANSNEVETQGNMGIVSILAHETRDLFGSVHSRYDCVKSMPAQSHRDINLNLAIG